eukprot:g7237.t1
MAAHQNAHFAAGLLADAVRKHSGKPMQVNFVTPAQIAKDVLPATFSFNLPAPPHMSDRPEQLARLAQDMARLAQDMARLAQDMARLAQDMARLAQDMARLAQDMARLAQDMVRLAQDMARLAQDMARLAQDMARLAQDMVDRLVQECPEGVKPCVSFGQANRLVYATVPATSTQGVISEADKAKQAVGGVQLVRFSFPPDMDRASFSSAITRALRSIYQPAAAL